jgi:hypothetical protein
MGLASVAYVAVLPRLLVVLKLVMVLPALARLFKL